MLPSVLLKGAWEYTGIRVAGRGHLPVGFRVPGLGFWVQGPQLRAHSNCRTT